MALLSRIGKTNLSALLYMADDLEPCQILKDIERWKLMVAFKKIEDDALIISFHAYAL